MTAPESSTATTAIASRAIEEGNPFALMVVPKGGLGTSADRA
jgi:hypothetical protein